MKIGDERKFRKSLREISLALCALQTKAHVAGLHLTGKAINKASQKLGWEAARLLEKKQ